MSVQQTINDGIKQAMRDKNDLDLTVLRQLKTACNNEAISLKKKDDGLSDDEVLAVLKREAKKRKDSIAQFTQAGRDDLAANEEKELSVLQRFLPEELSEEAIAEIVEGVIAEAGDAPQFGQIMSAVMQQAAGQADGTLVSKIVKEKLGS